jgi:hypothetical protein
MTPPEMNGDNQPPEMPNGDNMTPPEMNGDNQPPEMPNGDNNMTPPEMNGDNQPAEMPDGGDNGGKGGGFGGGRSEEISTEHHIQINGGYIYIDAQGDGIDSNSSIVINGGTVIVNGPTNGGDSALDHDGLFEINGGTVIAVGSNGMIENPSSKSEQNVLSAYLSSTQSANTIVSVVDESGNTIMAFKPTKSYAHLHFSSDKLETGKTYSVYVGGEYSGSFSADGVGENGKISGGTLDSEAAIESSLTQMGTSGQNRGAMGGFGDGNGGKGGKQQ